MKILYIDTETTGTDEHSSAIYQISGLVEIDGELVDEFDFVMNPGDVEIEDWVMDNLTSKELSLRDLISYKSQDNVFLEFISVLDKWIDKYDKSDKFHLCGYNVALDDRFMRAWFSRNNNDFYGAYIYSNRLDVMTLASYVLAPIRNKLTNFKLETICTLFDIEIDAHDAKSDIEGTYKLYQGLKNYLIVKELK